MIYYICVYADYTNLPEPLFVGSTGHETKSIDGSKFVAWSTGSIGWMNGAEPSFTHEEILTELLKPEWNED